MKTNTFLSILAILASALLGYLAYYIAQNKENDLLCGMFSWLCFAATIIPTIGLQYDNERIGVNVRVLSAVFFIAFLISHFCFAGFGVKMPYYLIVNGLILLVYLTIFYSIKRNSNV